MRAVPYKCLRCGLVNPMGSTTCRACGESLTGTYASGGGVAATPPQVGAAPLGSRTGATPTVPRSAAVGQAQASAAVGGSAHPLLRFFGWQVLQGRVIQVEPMHMAPAESRWGWFLVKLLVVAAILRAYGAFLLIPFIVVALSGWLLSRLLRGGFISAVAIQVASFMLTRRLLGPVMNVPVRDWRLRDGSGRETLVRVKGQLVTGSVSVGDDVTIEGWNRSGMLLFRRGHNNRISSALRVKRA